MQMASSSLLFLSVLVLLFAVSSLGQTEADRNGGRRQTIVLGKWGAQVTQINGKEFDDGAFTGVRVINFGYNPSTAIGGFQVTYDLNGKPFEGENHPSMIHGFTPVKISLDFPAEYVTEVSGHTDKVDGYLVVRSLAFKTNKKTYGPYGDTSGKPFNLPISNGVLVGFKGSVGYWLDNIGFYVSL